MTEIKHKHILLRLLLLTIVASPLVSHAQPVSIPGHIDVSAIGAASYQIPIEVVPGTGGVEPRLAVVYNSHAGIGLLGQKWTLHGVSSITRAPQSLHYDGKVSPVALDTSDRLSLDGQRLILLSGSSYYSSNAVLAFETEDFTRVKSVDYNGETGYRREMADGSVVEYGSDSQSRLTLGGYCLAWMVSRIVDANGNHMDYHYHQADGEILLDSISYTHRANGAPAYASVTFGYEAMTFSNDSYMCAQRVTQSKRLRKILVCYCGHLVRSYLFTYNTTLQYERLSSVQLCDSLEAVKATTTIGWEQPPQIFVVSSTMSSIPYGHYIVAGHFDDDRRCDIFTVERATRKCYVMKGNSDGTFLQPQYTGFQFTDNIYFQTAAQSCMAYDMDGDGVDEIIFSDMSNLKTCALRLADTSVTDIYPFSNGAPIQGDFDGDGSLELVTLWGNVLYCHGINGMSGTYATLPNTYNYCYAGDFDGDGKTDLVMLKNSTSYFYTYNTVSHSWEIFETDGFPNAYQFLVVGDFNGDGLSDLLFLPNNENNWKVAIRRGSNAWSLTTLNELDGSHPQPYSVIPTYPPFVCDINSDGRADIIQPVGTTVRCIVSRGVSDQQFVKYHYFTFSVPDNSAFVGGVFASGDFDGNGISDFVFGNPNTTGYSPTARFFYHGGRPGYLVQNIIDDAGNQSSFAYSPIPLLRGRYTGIDRGWMPLPLVSELSTPDGIGGHDTVHYFYGDSRYDQSSRRFMGFAYLGMLRDERMTETYLSPVDGYPTMLADSVVEKTLAESIPAASLYRPVKTPLANPPVASVLNNTVNSNHCLSRGTASGVTMFLPYTQQTTRYDHLQGRGSFTRTDFSAVNFLPCLRLERSFSLSDPFVRPTQRTTGYTYTDIQHTNGVQTTEPQRIVVTDYNSTAHSTARYDTTTYTYDADGRLQNVRHGDNGGYVVTTSYSYNTDGLVAHSTITPAGSTARSRVYEYDPTGRFVTTEVGLSGDTTSRSFDPKTGLVDTETDLRGLTTRYNYDFYGRTTGVDYPDGTKTTITYADTTDSYSDAVCYTTTSTDGQPVQRSYYDRIGRIVHTFVDGAGCHDIIYDNKGRKVKETAAPYSHANVSSTVKQWRVYSYDLYNRLTCDSSFSAVNTYNYGIDPISGDYFERVTDRRGSQSTTFYDAAGRISTITDGGGSVVYQYDRISTEGKVVDRTRVTNGSSTTTVWCDSRGNRVSLVDPDAGTINSVYNGWGNLTSMTDARGAVTTYAFNAHGRLIEKKYTMGSTTERYNYYYGTSAASKGQLWRIKRNGAIHTTYSYDSFGRIYKVTRKIDGASYIHRYTYDSLGRLYTKQFPSGYKVRYEYTAKGYLYALREHSTGSDIFSVYFRDLFGPTTCFFGNNTGVQIDRDAVGRATLMRYGNKEQDVPWLSNPLLPQGDELNNDPIINPIDPNPEPDPITYRVGSQYATLTYLYDSAGFIVRRTDGKTRQREDYSYDQLGRLSSFTVNRLHVRTFSYETNGNMSGNSRLGTDEYIYAGTQPHAVTIVPNDSGMINSARCDVTYNGRNRPSSISQERWTLNLLYGCGLQREKTTLTHDDTLKRSTLYIGDDCELETTPGSSRYIDLIKFGGRVVALHVRDTVAQTDSLYYVHSDLLGSWERVMNQSKVTVQRCHFDPWGNRMSATNWAQDIDGKDFPFHRGFTGHEHYDRFGIINMNARLYDPAVCRFFSPDPQLQNPFSTQGLNRYTYCNNNPVMFSDPTGELALLTAALIGAIVIGSINLGIHAYQGHVNNFWQGLGYFGQGALAGAIIGATWYGGLTWFSQASVFWRFAIATTKSIDIATTAASMMADPGNAGKILLGKYYFDEQMGHGFVQASTRFFWEAIQTWAGYNYTQFRNASGDVTRVDYLGGATFATKENAGKRDGVTIGSYININLRDKITGSFEHRVVNDAMFMHEYGHSFDSQILGPAYLLAIGIPSILSARKNSREGHKNFWTEIRANVHAKEYFSTHFNVNWDDYYYYGTTINTINDDYPVF